MKRKAKVRVWKGTGKVSRDGDWESKAFIGATKAVRESYREYYLWKPARRQGKGRVA